MLIGATGTDLPTTVEGLLGAELLGRLGQGECFGAAQSGKGRLYQVKDRGPRQEQDLARRMQRGYPDIELPLRVTWFTRPVNG